MTEAPKGYEPDHPPIFDGGTPNDHAELLRLYFDLRLANDGLDNDADGIPDATDRMPNVAIRSNFNPLAATTNAATGATGNNRERNMWGWTAIRRPRASVGHYTC